MNNSIDAAHASDSSRLLVPDLGRDRYLILVKQVGNVLNSEPFGLIFRMA